MDEEYFVKAPGAPGTDPADLPQLLHSPFAEPRSVRVLRGAGLALLLLGAVALAALPVLALKAIVTFFESLPF